MPSWQSTQAPQAHVKVGKCWCGYVTGRIGRTDQSSAGLYGSTRKDNRRASAGA